MTCLNGLNSEVYQLRGAGYKQREVAKMLDITLDRVKKICQNINIDAGKYEWIKPNLSKMEAKGYHGSEISDILSVPYEAVERYM